MTENFIEKVDVKRICLLEQGDACVSELDKEETIKKFCC